MAPVGFEWIVVIWYYATVVVGPVILFALVVLIAVVALRINGRLKRMMPAQTDAGAPLGDASDAAGGSDDDGSAERRRLQDGLEHARRELDLADAGLTRRERTVLLAACEGRTFASLAEEIGVSRSTVGTYCTRAYEKLGVDSREAALAWLERRSFAHALSDAGLTDGEVEVALMVADGASTADVAESLVLSEAAVNSRLQQVYSKLGVHSRAELAAMRGAGR